MTLIDHFNAFQRFCEIRNFTANARSLYYALLGEFNKCRFPTELQLCNSYLQQLSGIASRSSFDAARNVLISTNIITHKRGKYTLVTPVKVITDCSCVWQYPCRIAPPDPVTTESVQFEAALPTEDWKEYAAKYLSPEVLQAWLNSDGEILKGYKIFDFMNMEKLHGTKKIVDAIKEASISCQYNDFRNLSYKFFKMILENPNPPKGGKNSGNGSQNKSTAGDTAQYAGFDFG